MSGLRFIRASGSSCCGFPWSEAQVAQAMAQDHVHGTSDPIVKVVQPNGQAMGAPIGGVRQQRLVALATQLVVDGLVRGRATADELAFLRGEA